MSLIETGEGGAVWERTAKLRWHCTHRQTRGGRGKEMKLQQGWRKLNSGLKD